LDVESQLFQENIMNIRLQSRYTRASALQIICSVALIFASAILLAASSAQSVHAAVSESHPTWVTTGSLATGRLRHTATLLPSGKVLVAGGYGDTATLSSAELYDPTTGSWSSTGSLATRRWFHTATLLFSGKVLVTGGLDQSGNALSSAELYDPATGSWSSAGSLASAREDHTATLLPSGKVLVAGGFGDTAAPNSAELYDPATGSWSSTGSLREGRANHTATLLLSGKVLVAGGDYFNVTLSSAEFYDPARERWSSAGSLASAREDHTATLLPSGQVLVAGGFSFNNFIFLQTAELYDPVTKSWSSAGSLASARSDHTATLLPSGQVLVAGGYKFFTLSSAELYDPATGSWNSTTSLATGRWHHTATPLSSGTVLVAGGENDDVSFLSSAELYDPATVSQFTPAETTCSQFSSGTAETLPIVQYNLNRGLISQLNPPNFLYWVPVTAPAGNNVVTITQMVTSGNFSTFFAANGNGSNLFDSDCVLLQRQITQSGNTVTVTFNAPSAGTYFIAIKFNAQSFIREPAPSPTTVHYEFTATGVPHSTSGLDLAKH
jgi:N-acetylneuraminic acid mutarotase